MAIHSKQSDAVDFSDRDQIIWQISDHALIEAAGSINELTSAETRLTLQSLGLMEASQAVRFFDESQPEMIAVCQQLEGGVEGHAIFLINEDCAMSWLRELLNEKAQLKELTQMEEESLSELGNIILNNCLGNYVEVLKGPIYSHLPQLSRGHFTQLLQAFSSGKQEKQVFFLEINIESPTVQCQSCILWSGLQLKGPV